jgi:hypothetical protein
MSAAKNSVMNTKIQHEFHPDAESLNAFAEQALDERERNQVLGHLAVCPRCREVVALAQRAAQVEVEELAGAVTLSTAPERRRWKSWHLVWAPPAVALAAAIALVVYMHHERVERNAEMAKNAPPMLQNETLTNAPPSPQSQPAQAPASPASAEVADGKLKTEPAGRSAGYSLRQVVNAPAPAPPPAAAETVTVNAQLQPETMNADQAMAPEPLHGELQSAFKKSPSPHAGGQQAMQSEAMKQFEQRNRQLESAAVQDHLFAAKAAPAAIPQGAEANAARNDNGSVSTNSQPGALSAGSLSSFAEFKGAVAMADVGKARKNIHLPSKLTSISTVFAGSRVLAIDSANTLFVSQDSGSAWTRVSPQWTGRAILVRAHDALGDLDKSINSRIEVAPTAGVAGNALPAATPVPSPSITFEIVNDKDRVWTSSDGLVWTAR